MADNLFNQITGNPPDPAEQDVPAMLLSSDNHNIGNQGSSWFEPTTWGTRVEHGLQFGASAVISGAAQLYNSGVTIGGWAGIGDGQTKDIKDIVSGFDSNLGDYYQQNRQGVDLVGFIASSFIPGLGGIKVLNAGQHALEGALATGSIGRNIAEATGLLVPKTERYIAAAAQDINAAQATFSAITQNGIKALATGVRQQALEGLAFETMVQATMFKSPVLEGQDTGDIIKNLVLGGVLGGVVGGAFEGVSSYSKIMNKVKVFELETKYASARVAQQELNRPDLNVIRNAQDAETAAMPIPPTAGASPKEVALYQTQLRQVEQRLVRTQNDMRTNINALGNGDDNTVTNMVADTLRGASSESVMESMLHATEIARVGVKTAVETELGKAQKALLDTGAPVPAGLQTNYVKLTGEGAGKVFDSEPIVKNLADTVSLSREQTIAESIMQKVKDYKFKIDQLWDAASKLGVTSHTEAEARYLWVDSLKEIKSGTVVHMNDIPLLERAWKDGQLAVKLTDNTGAIVKDGFSSRDELWKHLVETKEDVASQLMGKRAFKGNKSDELVAEAAAKITNTKLSRLDRTVIGDDAKDYLAHQSASEDYQNFLRSKSIIPKGDEDIRLLPTYAKVSRRVPDEMLADANGHALDGATWIKTQEKMAQEAMDRVFAKAAGPLAELVPNISEDILFRASKQGAGAKLTAFASGGYGSPESVMQAVGQVTQKLKTAFRQTTSDTLQGPLAALGRNQEAAIEFSTVNQKVTRSAKQWVRYADEDGTEHLVTTDALKALRDEKDPISLAEIDAGEKIQLHNAETYNAIDAMISRSSNRTSTFGELRAAQGKIDSKNPEVFRPIQPNPKDYPYVAFVKDDKVTGQGHTTMLFGNTEQKLASQVQKAEQAGYRVHYKTDSEDFMKAKGDYEYSRTLNENYIDHDLKNKGIYSETFTKTDPQKIINDIVQQHLREDDVLAMELMRGKHQKAFDFLEDQGKAYSRVEASKIGGSIQKVEASGKNPYMSYVKTALDISKSAESPLLYGFNKFLDEGVSKAVGAARDVWNASRTPFDATQVQGVLEKYGMKNAYHDAALDLLVNHTAPRGELTKFVRTANSIMSTLTLGLDPMNSLVNMIGANVLRGTELKQLTDSINGGNDKLAGQLTGLAKIDVTGKGDYILSPAKLYAQAQKNFFSPEAKDLMKRYSDAGYVIGDASKFHSILDDFALKGTETVEDLNSRVNRAFAVAKQISEKGRTLTGNKFAEDYNRFITADCMRQLTDLAEEHGLLTRAESHSYINTFVNRVDGNTVASQRPLMFQGPLGNAIGLFQSYQFNMMQNLFRYTAEGKGKDVAMLMGLQGTFFGLNGLPGFQFINQHIIGTASGNKNHVDLYDATYGAAGKQMGDLLMYGLPSDLLHANLYSRGDINPRSLTIVPTAIKDIPFVSGFTNLLGSIKDATSRMSNGADVWGSILQGVEHNGISRPLAGMAQVMEATGPGGKPYSTTTKGSILFSNDLLSLASLTRLAGSRPLDEAIVNDGVFRIHAYQQADRDKMNTLAEAVKTSSIEGRQPDEDQMIKFASKYAAAGGKTPQFNKWVLNEMKNANLNESQKITKQLQNPFAQKVQLLMGGDTTDAGY